MKKLFILSFLFVAPFVMLSQVPGYLGKRFSVGYSAYLAPTLAWPSYFSESSYEPGINLLNCLDIDYVIKRRTAFCFSAQYGKTGLAYDREYSSGGYNIRYDPKDNRPIGLKMMNFSLGFKFYGRRQIAPLGTYTKLDLVIISSKLDFDKNGFYTGSEPRIIYPMGNKSFSYNSFAIGVTLGRQRIFYDAIILDTGFRFGITPQPFLDVLSEVDLFDSGNGSSSGYGSGSLDSQFGTEVRNRLLGAQLFNLHLGIGFLAF